MKVYIITPSSSGGNLSTLFAREREGGAGREGREGDSREEEFKIALRTFSAGGGRIIRDLEGSSLPL